MDSLPYLHAMALHLQSQVPRWYSLAPLEKSTGLQLTLHEKTWQDVLAFCGSFADPCTFNTGPTHDGWLTIKFSYVTKQCQSLQRTLAYVLDALNCVQGASVDPGEFQLSACGVLRSEPELKGYLMEAYISYELKQLLQEKGRDQIAKLATSAMRKASQCLKNHVHPERFRAAVQEGGFIYFGISDGSGTCFATDYRDLEPMEIQTGYCMNSDNIDSPHIQLVFLYALAAVTEWGRKQFQRA